MDVRRQPELQGRALDEFGGERPAITFLANGDARDVVRWAAGEAHETVATSSFSAVVVEASELRLG